MKVSMGSTLTQLARVLRKRPTDAEQALWNRLRNRQLEGFKFRRQHPIGRYIVDFVNLENCLVVELDGGQHAFRTDQDAKRDHWLWTEGYRVIRFWNAEVLENLAGVLEAIREELVTPSPNPSPQGRGKD